MQSCDGAFASHRHGLTIVKREHTYIPLGVWVFMRVIRIAESGAAMTQRAQVKLAVVHGWAPEIGACFGFAEGEQGIDDAVFGAAHATQQGLEGVEAEWPKAVNTRPPRLPSAHGMERRSTKASGAKLSWAVRLTWADCGRIVQFFVAVGIAPDGVVLLQAWHGFEQVELVVPVLQREEAAAGQRASAVGQEGHFERLVVLRVFGAVFIAGQVAAIGVVEGVGDVGDLEGRREQGFQVLAAFQQFAAGRCPATRPGGRWVWRAA